MTAGSTDVRAPIRAIHLSVEPRADPLRSTIQRGPCSTRPAMRLRIARHGLQNTIAQQGRRWAPCALSLQDQMKRKLLFLQLFLAPSTAFRAVRRPLSAGMELHSIRFQRTPESGVIQMIFPDFDGIFRSTGTVSGMPIPGNENPITLQPSILIQIHTRSIVIAVSTRDMIGRGGNSGDAGTPRS